MKKSPKGIFLILLLFAILLLASVNAQAVSRVGAEYSAWSEWQKEPFQAGNGLEIESQVMLVTETNYTWRYTRYIYYNQLRNNWYAAAQEQTGAHVQEGSGYWEGIDSPQPLEVVGEDGGDVVYGDGWFNEQVLSEVVKEKRTMYRSRQVRKITCDVSEEEILLFPNETRQLKVNFYDGGTMTFVSDNEDIATVDQTGLIRAQAIGCAMIMVSSNTGRQVTVEVMVCQKGAHIENGVYTMRLLGSSRTMTTASTLASKTRQNIVTDEYTGVRSQRFVLTNITDENFTLHPINSRRWYVDIATLQSKIVVGSNVQTNKKRNTYTQTFRAVYVPDGSYILYPKNNTQICVGAEDAEAGNNVWMERIDPSGNISNLDRWVLIKANTAIKQENDFERPVSRDGVSFVEKEFSPEEPYMIFGSNKKKVYVLSAGRGTVIEIGDECEHNYAKTPGQDGALVDPCDGKTDNLGKYIVVEHSNGITTKYAYLSTVYVKLGDTVRQGSLIGRSGATGSTDAVKLYFQMCDEDEPMDPRIDINLPVLGAPIVE